MSAVSRLTVRRTPPPLHAVVGDRRLMTDADPSFDERHVPHHCTWGVLTHNTRATLAEGLL